MIGIQNIIQNIKNFTFTRGCTWYLIVGCKIIPQTKFLTNTLPIVAQNMILTGQYRNHVI